MKYSRDLIKKRAIFLDRDGTLNIEKHYLYKKEDLELIDGTVEAIKLCHDMGLAVIVVTNQSGVARGYYKEQDVVALHEYLNEMLRMEVLRQFGQEILRPIDHFYYCPHHEEAVVEEYRKSCYCRKPNKGMIDAAVEDHKKRGIDLDLSQSIIVGDQESDISLGISAGIGMKVLVRSGEYKGCISDTKADRVCEDLLEFILSMGP